MLYQQRYFTKLSTCLLGLFLGCSPLSAMSQMVAKDSHTHENIQDNRIQCNEFTSYIAFSGGYGRFDNAADDSGETGFQRLALGALWPLTVHSSLGAEIGIQSGNQQTLTTDVSSIFGVNNALPIILMVKPPIDFLAVYRYQFNSPIFIQAKAGIAYFRTATESTAIPSDDEWNPAMQLGIGYNVSSHVKLVLSYQQYFGQTPKLTDVNVAAGTGTVQNVPTWQAGMLSVEINL